MDKIHRIHWISPGWLDWRMFMQFLNSVSRVMHGRCQERGLCPLTFWIFSLVPLDFFSLDTLRLLIWRLIPWTKSSYSPCQKSTILDKTWTGPPGLDYLVFFQIFHGHCPDCPLSPWKKSRVHGKRESMEKSGSQGNPWTFYTQVKSSWKWK